MPHEKETTTKAGWAAHTDAPTRSVFGNYQSEATVADENDAAAPSGQPAGNTVVATIGGERPALFPLPTGEGQGEGERHIRSLQSAIDLAVARSFVYRFVAKCFEDPAYQGWASLTDPQVQADFRAAISVLSESRPDFSSLTEKLLAALTPTALETFTDSYLVVFGHAARGPCPMNEIEYGNLKADSLFQPHRLADLNAFYRAFGLELADDASERPDHICLELEFMSVLAAKEAYALEHQLDTDQLAVGREAQKMFLREHLGHWVPAFTRRLEREAGPGVLAALAAFTREFLLGECARFAVAPGNEDLLLRPVDDAAENLCSSCGITNLPPGALTTA